MDRSDFFVWLDSILEGNLPDEVVAVNLNLYDRTDNNWAADFIGADHFDLEDEDWACDEVFLADEQFEWKRDADWKTVLAEVVEALQLYLEVGMFGSKLTAYQGVGVGFVDGNIEIVHTA